MRGFEYEPSRTYTPPYKYNQNYSLQAEPTHDRRIIEPKKALQRFQVSMASSSSMTTPHASRTKGAA